MGAFPDMAEVFAILDVDTPKYIVNRFGIIRKHERYMRKRSMRTNYREKVRYITAFSILAELFSLLTSS